jgi:DNA-binding transcriptional ArsR family regulator
VDAEKQQQELDDVLAALAHEVRRHVLLVVWCRGGAMSAGEIAGRFTHSWPTTSRHLRVLEDAGLLTFEKQGRNRVYRVNQTKMLLVQDWLRWFRQIPAEQTVGAPVRPDVLLRNIALAYPETKEVIAEDERLIKVRSRTFLVLRCDGHACGLSVRLPISRTEALKLPSVQPIQYRLGRSDWVMVRVDLDGELSIELLWEWIDESYRAVAPSRLLRQLGPPPRADR